jgi:hypothetical protein
MDMENFFSYLRITWTEIDLILSITFQAFMEDHGALTKENSYLNG